MARLILALLLLGLLLVPPVFAATDYRSMSEEQLRQQGTTMGTMSPGDRQAFSEEWYRRYQRMPLEEQMRMEQKAAGVYGQGSAPAGTYLPGGPGSSTSGTSQTMSQPSGTATRDRMASSTDYRSMSEEQLRQQGTTMGTMSPGDRQAFSEEWYRRYQRMPLEEQMRMEQKAAGVYGQGSAPAGTYLPGGPGSSTSGTTQPMGQSGGTVSREEMSQRSTTQQTVPGAMQQPGMSQQSDPMAQWGAVRGGSQADMGARSDGSMTTAETYRQTRDYRTMSNEELNRMMSPEGQRSLTPEQRTEARREFESRISTFTPEERQRYLLGSSRTMSEAR